MNKKGEMGIGTLVLFIAMILVAAIAAGVLIQTATSLQSKALETGRRTTTEVSTSLKTILLYGEDASVNRSITDVRQHIQITAGSDPIKFNDTVIAVDTMNQSRDLTMDQNQLWTDLNHCTQANGTFYRVYYVKSSSKHVDGYINVGEVVQLCYELPREVFEDEVIRVNIIPATGSSHTVSVNTPGTMITKRVFLFP